MKLKNKLGLFKWPIALFILVATIVGSCKKTDILSEDSVTNKPQNYEILKEQFFNTNSRFRN